MKTKDDALAAKDVELKQQSGLVSELTAKLQSAESDAATQRQIAAEAVAARQTLESQLQTAADERRKKELELEEMAEELRMSKICERAERSNMQSEQNEKFALAHTLNELYDSEVVNSFLFGIGSL